MLAYRHTSGNFKVIESYSGEAYALKDQLKANGGQWNPAEKAWFIPESSLELLNITKMIMVSVNAYCCFDAGAVFLVPEYDIDRGFTRITYCAKCDSSMNEHVRILGQI